jgi:hypothetical protein
MPFGVAINEEWMENKDKHTLSRTHVRARRQPDAEWSGEATWLAVHQPLARVIVRVTTSQLSPLVSSARDKRDSSQW